MGQYTRCLQVGFVGKLRRESKMKCFEKSQFFGRHTKIYKFQFVDFLGPSPVITVNDYETCLKLFVNEADVYSDRPHMEHFNQMTRGKALCSEFWKRF